MFLTVNDHSFATRDLLEPMNGGSNSYLPLTNYTNNYNFHCSAKWAVPRSCHIFLGIE